MQRATAGSTFNPVAPGPIGGTTPAAITGTTITATTAFNVKDATLQLTQYATKQLMISGDGTGATTNAGLIVGYPGISGYGALWASAGPAPAFGNSMLVGNGSITQMYSDNWQVLTVTGNALKINQLVTAGRGPDFTAGTAASVVSAQTITQTWNFNTSAITGVSWAFTDTSSHANTLAFQILTGAGGSTNAFSVSKAGNAVVAGTLSLPLSGVAVVATNATTTTGANVGTLTNCPHTGNPALYWEVSVNGATYCIPCYALS